MLICCQDDAQKRQRSRYQDDLKAQIEQKKREAEEEKKKQKEEEARYVYYAFSFMHSHNIKLRTKGQFVLKRYAFNI